MTKGIFPFFQIYWIRIIVIKISRRFLILYKYYIKLEYGEHVYNLEKIDYDSILCHDQSKSCQLKSCNMVTQSLSSTIVSKEPK
jgi:hypothetical protein